MGPTSPRVFVAGHRGLVGSALVRRAPAALRGGLLLRSRSELDLRDGSATRQFFDTARPDIVIVAAARVGGIVANATQPYAFIHDNLAITLNVIEAARASGVRRLVYLGSSCIYPRLAQQPIAESSLLTGPLEATNRPYALAKIAGIELCWSSNREHGTAYFALMPCNLYGEGDNYHPEHSHVIPGLIRRFDAARRQGLPSVTVWGTGTPLREFMHADDLADACWHLLAMPEERLHALWTGKEAESPAPHPPLLNVGTGVDLSIADLARRVAHATGYGGRIEFDPSKPDGTPRKRLDVTRIQTSGWTPRIGLDEGLARACADYRARFGDAVPQG